MLWDKAEDFAAGRAEVRRGLADDAAPHRHGWVFRVGVEEGVIASSRKVGGAQRAHRSCAVARLWARFALPTLTEHPSIHDEQLRACLRRRPMRGVAEIRHLIAHARQQLEGAAVAQFGIEFALEHVEHVAAVAPVIGEVARRILDHPDPQVADIKRAPQRFAGFARMRRRRDLAPVGDGEGQCGIFMRESLSVTGERLRSNTPFLPSLRGAKRRSNPCFRHVAQMDCFAIARNDGIDHPQCAR